MTSHRYRSQFFQAFSRQTMRLGDRLAQTWRQAKLTATWGTQILLYPIYALYQTTRLTRRSIGQTISRILPQLQSAPAFDPANPPLDEQIDRDPPADTPIVRSLLAVSGLELANLTPILPAADGVIAPVAVAPIVVVDLPGSIAPSNCEIIPSQTETIESATVRVRGIASLLSDRRLVLTTIHNQLLDVLTADQQIQLQQRLIWELASYRRLLRLRSAGRALPLPTDSPHLLPPIRGFQRVMAWMQQSPIAIATNLFGEAAQLPAALPDPVLSPSEPRSIPQSPWAWLSNLLRLAESGAIVVAESTELATTAPNPPQRFGWKRKRLAASSTDQTPIAAFGREFASLPPQGFDRNLATIDRSTSNQQIDLATGALSIETESTMPAAAPAWIETEAHLVGYVKHPLEQFLEWLDSGMLWLETQLTNFWHWLTR